MKQLIFVFTNYNNTSFTEKALDSISRSDAFDSRVVVVDNGSKDKEVALLRNLEEKYNNLLVVYSDENLGYFPGLNLGLKTVRNLPEFTDETVVIVGNNDLLFDSMLKQQIFEDESLIERYPVISPNITMLDGTQQNPHVIKRISKFRELVYDLYHFNYYLACLILKIAKLTHSFTDRSDESYFAIEQEIYQGYGACYVLTPLYFSFFDELPNDTFLMYEEFFLAKQLHSVGYLTLYRPTIKVRHFCHAATGSLPGKFRWSLSKVAHKKYRKFVKLWH